MLVPGDPVPSFYARGLTNPRYAFDSVAGRHVLVSFIASTRVPGISAYLDRLHAARDLFNDRFASAFIVSADPRDEQDSRLTEDYPGIRVFWDHDLSLARLFGCVRSEGGEPSSAKLDLTSWLIDPGLRVLDRLPIDKPATHMAAIKARLAGLPDPAEDVSGWAPVLHIPDVIEPDLCRAFINYCEREGVEDSGFMRTDHATGRTVMVVDHTHKRRADCSIEDHGLRGALQSRVLRRIIPAMERAFQFRATRMERYMIACYDAGTGGYFRPHKDNTTLGTAHRRFAVSIGLDADGYDGGDLRFPEFGMRRYRPATGGAVVFSCSLLHEVLPVTRGRRYAILPFLYDEAAARLRLENARHLDDPELREQVIASVTARPAAA